MKTQCVPLPGNQSAYLAQFPISLVLFVSSAHSNNPTDSEFSKVSSFKKSHEDSTENGKRVPRICCDYLWKNAKPCFNLKKKKKKNVDSIKNKTVVNLLTFFTS